MSTAVRKVEKMLNRTAVRLVRWLFCVYNFSTNKSLLEGSQWESTNNQTRYWDVAESKTVSKPVISQASWIIVKKESIVLICACYFLLPVM